MVPGELRELSVLRYGLSGDPTRQGDATIHRELENAHGCSSSGGGGGQDPCTITRNYISANATKSYNEFYPWVYQVLTNDMSYFRSGRLHGFYFIYETPPIYCTTNPQYTPAPRPYYATWDQALRVVTQFYNNGYYIESAGVW